MKTISTTWPWEVCTVEQCVQHVKALNSQEISFRATDGIWLLGMDDGTRQRWQGKTHQNLEQATKDAGLRVSIWCVAYLRDWAKEAALIKEVVNLYRPTAVFLDAESKQFVVNTGPFLRALGRLPCPLYLQSFRRASGHPEMAWQKWYTYRDEQTEQYIIDGLGHQLYPIGWNTPEQWVDQFKRDIESHQVELKQAGRPDLPWYPTVSTFVGGAAEGAPGWRPTPEAVLAANDWMVQNLGSRLIGVNFWCLDRHLAKMPELYQAVAGLKLPPGPLDPKPSQPSPSGAPATAGVSSGTAAEAVILGPGAVAFDLPTASDSAGSLAEWVSSIDAWARRRGYQGIKPPQ